jgi:hypothetical protein
MKEIGTQAPAGTTYQLNKKIKTSEENFIKWRVNMRTIARDLKDTVRSAAANQDNGRKSRRWKTIIRETALCIELAPRLGNRKSKEVATHMIARPDYYTGRRVRVSIKDELEKNSEGDPPEHGDLSLTLLQATP